MGEGPKIGGIEITIYMSMDIIMTTIKSHFELFMVIIYQH